MAGFPQMRKLRDWAERLESALRADYARPPTWWHHDCSSSVARYLLAETGVDMFAPFRTKRNRYDNEVKAGGAIRRVIGVPRDWNEKPAVEALAEFMAARHGLREVTRPELERPCVFAGRGDPVLLEAGDLASGATDLQLGILDTSGRRVATLSKRGLLRLPVEQVALRRAWHVPDWRPQ